jgi:hypothetical protein
MKGYLESCEVNNSVFGKGWEINIYQGEDVWESVYYYPAYMPKIKLVNSFGGEPHKMIELPIDMGCYYIELVSQKVEVSDINEYDYMGMFINGGLKRKDDLYDLIQ